MARRQARPGEGWRIIVVLPKEGQQPTPDLEEDLEEEPGYAGNNPTNPERQPAPTPAPKVPGHGPLPLVTAGARAARSLGDLAGQAIAAGTQTAITAFKRKWAKRQAQRGKMTNSHRPSETKDIGAVYPPMPRSHRNTWPIFYNKNGIIVYKNGFIYVDNLDVASVLVEEFRLSGVFYDYRQSRIQDYAILGKFYTQPNGDLSTRYLSFRQGGDQKRLLGLNERRLKVIVEELKSFDSFDNEK